MHIFNRTHVRPSSCFEFFDWTCLVWMLNLMNSSSSLLLFWDPIRCTYPTQSCGWRPECVCLSKGKRRGRNTWWFLPANTLHWAWCISIRAVTNNTGCRYVSQHQRETSAKVVSSFIDPVWNRQLPQRKTEWRTKEWRSKASMCVHVCVCISPCVYVCINHVCVHVVCITCPSNVTGLFATICLWIWNCLCRTRSLQPDKQGAVEFPAEVSLSEAPLPSFVIALCDSTQQAWENRPNVLDGWCHERDNYQAVSEVSQGYGFSQIIYFM